MEFPVMERATPFPVEDFAILIDHYSGKQKHLRPALIEATYRALGFVLDDHLETEKQLGNRFPPMLAGPPSLSGAQLAQMFTRYCERHNAAGMVKNGDTEPSPTEELVAAVHGEDRHFHATDSGKVVDVPPADVPIAIKPASAPLPASYHVTPSDKPFPAFLAPCLIEQLKVLICKR